jgi:hypothetical protein
MPRYFFDFRDGVFEPDQEGTILGSLDDAKREAAVALSELAVEVLPGSESQELMIDVREEAGPVLFTAKLVFAIQDGAPGKRP